MNATVNEHDSVYTSGLTYVCEDRMDLKLKPLLVLGGLSTRMGARKELLPFPDTRPAYQHTLATIHSAVPTASTIYLSLASKSQSTVIAYTPTNSSDPSIAFLYDEQREQSIGPAAGLLAAHAEDPQATWMVVGCDYPLLPPTALQQLILEYQEPVTCFLNEAGFSEPMLAIWGPDALTALRTNVEAGNTGMNRVIKQLGGKTVRPLREEWIRGANTKEDWEAAMRIVRETAGP